MASLRPSAEDRLTSELPRCYSQWVLYAIDESRCNRRGRLQTPREIMTAALAREFPAPSVGMRCLVRLGRTVSPAVLLDFAPNDVVFAVLVLTPFGKPDGVAKAELEDLRDVDYFSEQPPINLCLLQGCAEAEAQAADVERRTGAFVRPVPALPGGRRHLVVCGDAEAVEEARRLLEGDREAHLTADCQPAPSPTLDRATDGPPVLEDRQSRDAPPTATIACPPPPPPAAPGNVPPQLERQRPPPLPVQDARRPSTDVSQPTPTLQATGTRNPAAASQPPKAIPMEGNQPPEAGRRASDPDGDGGSTEEPAVRPGMRCVVEWAGQRREALLLRLKPGDPGTCHAYFLPKRGLREDEDYISLAAVQECWFQEDRPYPAPAHRIARPAFDDQFPRLRQREAPPPLPPPPPPPRPVTAAAPLAPPPEPEVGTVELPLPDPRLAQVGALPPLLEQVAAETRAATELRIERSGNSLLLLTGTSTERRQAWERLRTVFSSWGFVLPQLPGNEGQVALAQVGPSPRQVAPSLPQVVEEPKGPDGTEEPGEPEAQPSGWAEDSGEEVMDVSYFAPGARFFVIKSSTAVTVAHSRRKGIWSSTWHGNKTLAAAWEQSGPCGVYLLFSVAGSRQFCGYAQMTSAVRWEPEWWPVFGKAEGVFDVRWLGTTAMETRWFKYSTNIKGDPIDRTRDAAELPEVDGRSIVTKLRWAHNEAIRLKAAHARALEATPSALCEAHPDKAAPGGTPTAPCSGFQLDSGSGNGPLGASPVTRFSRRRQ